MCPSNQYTKTELTIHNDMENRGTTTGRRSIPRLFLFLPAVILINLYLGNIASATLPPTPILTISENEIAILKSLYKTKDEPARTRRVERADNWVAAKLKKFSADSDRYLEEIKPLVGIIDQRGLFEQINNPEVRKNKTIQENIRNAVAYFSTLEGEYKQQNKLVELLRTIKHDAQVSDRQNNLGEGRQTKKVDILTHIRTTQETQQKILRFLKELKKAQEMVESTTLPEGAESSLKESDSKNSMIEIASELATSALDRNLQNFPLANSSKEARKEILGLSKVSLENLTKLMTNLNKKMEIASDTAAMKRELDAIVSKLDPLNRKYDTLPLKDKLNQLRIKLNSRYGASSETKHEVKATIATVSEFLKAYNKQLENEIKKLNSNDNWNKLKLENLTKLDQRITIEAKSNALAALPNSRQRGPSLEKDRQLQQIQPVLQDLLRYEDQQREKMEELHRKEAPSISNKEAKKKIKIDSSFKNAEAFDLQIAAELKAKKASVRSTPYTAVGYLMDLTKRQQAQLWKSKEYNDLSTNFEMKVKELGSKVEKLRETGNSQNPSLELKLKGLSARQIATDAKGKIEELRSKRTKLKLEFLEISLAQPEKKDNISESEVIQDQENFLKEKKQRLERLEKQYRTLEKEIKSGKEKYTQSLVDLLEYFPKSASDEFLSLTLNVKDDFTRLGNRVKPQAYAIEELVRASKETHDAFVAYRNSITKLQTTRGKKIKSDENIKVLSKESWNQEKQDLKWASMYSGLGTTMGAVYAISTLTLVPPVASLVIGAAMGGVGFFCARKVYENVRDNVTTWRGTNVHENLAKAQKEGEELKKELKKKEQNLDWIMDGIEGAAGILNVDNLEVSDQEFVNIAKIASPYNTDEYKDKRNAWNEKVTLLMQSRKEVKWWKRFGQWFSRSNTEGTWNYAKLEAEEQSLRRMWKEKKKRLEPDKFERDLRIAIHKKVEDHKIWLELFNIENKKKANLEKSLEQWKIPENKSKLFKSNLRSVISKLDNLHRFHSEDFIQDGEVNIEALLQPFTDLEDGGNATSDEVAQMRQLLTEMLNEVQLEENQADPNLSNEEKVKKVAEGVFTRLRTVIVKSLMEYQTHERASIKYIEETNTPIKEAEIEIENLRRIKFILDGEMAILEEHLPANQVPKTEEEAPPTVVDTHNSDSSKSCSETQPAGSSPTPPSFWNHLSRIFKKDPCKKGSL